MGILIPGPPDGPLDALHDGMDEKLDQSKVRGVLPRRDAVMFMVCPVVLEGLVQ